MVRATIHLPTAIQPGAAGVGANARLQRIQVDAGLLHGDQLVVVGGVGQLQGGKVGAIEAEALPRGDRQEAVPATEETSIQRVSVWAMFSWGRT